MTRSLEDRLKDAVGVLEDVRSALGRNPGKLPTAVDEEVRKVLEYRSSLEHCCGTLAARRAAANYLDQLETRVDGDDCVPFGEVPIKFEHARMIGVQAYLTMTWAVADRVSGMAGRVLCTAEKGHNLAQPAQLVSHFMNRNGGAGKSSAGGIFLSIRHSFGWPVGLSYALRNHFVHDAAHLDGYDFFAGFASASAFEIAPAGWDRVVKQAKAYGVEDTMHRAGAAWPAAPLADLRIVLNACEQQVDNALGTLVGSASHAFRAHVGLLLGED